MIVRKPEFKTMTHKKGIILKHNEPVHEGSTKKCTKLLNNRGAR
jgi:hypothetical protein